MYTVGHSTHPFDEFVELLRAHDVEQVVDVRSVPPIASQPPVRTRCPHQSPPQPGHSLSMDREARRTAPHHEKLHQRRLAQHLVPRLRRLHANRALPRRHRPIMHRRNRSRHHDHVRRSRPVAMPPIDDRRRPTPTRLPGPRHHEPHLSQTTHHDIIRENRRNTHLVPTRSFRIGRLCPMFVAAPNHHHSCRPGIVRGAPHAALLRILQGPETVCASASLHPSALTGQPSEVPPERRIGRCGHHPPG